MSKTWKKRAATAMSMAITLTACGPGVVKDVVGQPETPKNPTAFKCDENKLHTKLSPYIIDWPGSLRGDIEMMMRDKNVAVVAFSCDEVKVLADCEVPGDYGFAGLSPKRDNTLIEGADDIRASFGGVQFGAQAEFNQSAKLDLATITVGKYATPRKTLTRDELGAGCEGATHFVRRADVGAFAMSTGSNIQAGAALEVFGQGVSGGSRSNEQRSNMDGDPNKCKAASRKNLEPPEGCGALIQLSLTPIKEGELTTADAKTAKGIEVDAGCPDDFVPSDKGCVKKAEVKTAKVKHYLCAEKDQAECEKQCLAGSDQSCGHLSNILENSADVETMPALSPPLLRRVEDACYAQVAAACPLAALQAFRPVMKALSTDPVLSGNAPDEEKVEALKKYRKPLRKAFGFAEVACIAGDDEACEGIVSTYMDDGMENEVFRTALGVTDGRVAAKNVLERGCNAGSGGACQRVYLAALQGKFGIEKKDFFYAVDAAEKACLGGYPKACGTAAMAYFAQPSVCDGTPLSFEFDAKDLTSCELMVETARNLGLEPNAEKAKRLTDRACKLGGAAVCKK